MPREICHNETRCIDLTNDFIIDFIYVLNAIYSKRIISGAQQTRLKAFLICVIERYVEPHCNKPLCRGRLRSS